ncbi:hypothetical protein B0A55_02501 [Friedmanniomyces simplex]|uniref:Peptidase metallopeptidase domain-containing protein n=1 Tax=Friedmanniomyces simplex TaxID=329884 RepID=A0A4V5NHY5_9PEZI|nr:hypothetical protein B0A55_02501 [Friedmanniomyces simplex]
MSTTATTQLPSIQVAKPKPPMATGENAGPPAPSSNSADLPAPAAVNASPAALSGNSAVPPASTTPNTGPQTSPDNEFGVPPEHLVCMQMLDEAFVSQNGGVPASNAVRRPAETNGDFTLTLTDSLKWENGRTITVKLLGGSELVRAKVKQYAVLWSQYASIQFRFVDEGNADVKVSFIQDHSSHSKVGILCLDVDQSLPTMNFGWFHDDTAEAEFQRTIVHEFGHVLGAFHEQNNPNLHINWNKEVVYAYYLEKDGWNRSIVDQNMFTPVRDPDATAWDRNSIMQYKILADWNFDGVSVGENWVLSDQDKAFIRAMYPPTQVDKGYWLSGESGQINQTSWSENIRYDSEYSAPPLLGLGLSRIDAWHDPMGTYAVCLSTWAENNRATMFDLQFDGWPVRNFGAGATWVEFDAGRYPNVEVNTRGFSFPAPTRAQGFNIRFRNAHAAPPKVLVWLNGLAMGSGTQSKCMGTTLGPVTTTGCSLAISSLNSDSDLYMGNATYVVIPADTPGIQIGNVNAGVPGIGAVPGHQVVVQPASNAIPVRFAAGAFSTVPKVFLAVNQLDYSRGDFVRLNAYVTDVSVTGFTAHFDTWAQSEMLGVAGTWIAMV